MKKITIKDVAKAAGVSRALVSIAYRGVAGVSEATAEHIFAVGKSLGYVPNLNAVRLASKGLKTIGVFLQDLHNEVFAEIYDGIRSVIDEGEVQLVLTVGQAAAGHDSKALDALLASRVDVVIAAGLTMSDHELQKYAARTKLISVTRSCSGVTSVVANDYLGARLATEHLAQHHKEIAFLANPQTDGYRDRLRGYQDAMTDSGLKHLVRETTYSRKDAELDAEVLLSSGASAIFAHNDLAALGVLDAVISSGRKPGLDVAVVGFDNTSLSQTPVLALTTVDPHSHELGQKAAELALVALTDENAPRVTIELTPALQVRSSSLSS